MLYLAVDEVAKHDVAWGNMEINWISDDIGNPYKQYYVSVDCLRFLMALKPN